MKTIMVGIDEAGRGCVIGPMALAAVAVDSEGWQLLAELGVRDSKLLSPQKREAFIAPIKATAVATSLRLVAPEKIDGYCHKNLLNLLEAETAALLIDEIRPQVVYIDAPGKNGRKFRSQVQQATHIDCRIIAENHADSNYPVVAAASIIAKVARDKAIAELRARYGDFGSGYPSDSKTRSFLERVYQKQRSFPDFVRQSWSTVKQIREGYQACFFD